ncbi:MAG TPA: DegV family protein [Anaerolineales bacterium]|nr:DegV family protein [Anaerolineales bacterium]
MKISIVTDSTCDIPYETADACSISIVPNLLVVDGKSIEDGKDFSRQGFYERLPGMRTFPTTASPSLAAFAEAYVRCFDQGADAIISIQVSQKLSAVHNTASLAAQSFDGRVHVFDSQNVSLGLGFQALAAAEAASAGLPLESVLARLEDIRRRVHLVAMLDTLEYVRRSGRVSWARASLGAFLNIKPFVEVRGGQVYSLGETRTRRKGIARLLELIEDLGALERLAILHSNAEGDARQLAEIFAPRLPRPPFVVNVTTVIGAHVGPNGLGFAAVVAP